MAPGNDRLPGGLIPVEELGKLVENGSVSTVMLAMTDMQGRLKGKRHPARFFLDHLVEHGSEGCAYLLATDAEMRPLPGYGIASWESGYGDVRLVPDLRTLRRLPWHRGGVLVLADVEHTDGRPLPVAPRQVLHEQITRLADLGLTARTGLETEFTVYRGTTEQALYDPQPLSPRNLDYALVRPLAVAEYVHEVEEVLSESELPLEAVKPEAAPGQIEVTFRYGDPLTSADNHSVFKHIVKTITPWTESTATFMAAPVTGVGNGLHVHLSLWRGDEPAFTTGDGGLLTTGLQAVAGLVEVLPQLMPLLLPTPNSYKRLRPYSFAPTRAAWGWDNRTCAIRVTGHGKGLHLEIRIPGADANPHLAVAAVLAACRHGISRQLQPPSAVSGNAYEFIDAPLLPAGLDAALLAFQAGPAARDLFGEQVVSHYATAARIECEVTATRVTDVERDRGSSMPDITRPPTGLSPRSADAGPSSATGTAGAVESRRVSRIGPPLAPREREALGLIADGLGTVQIAEKCGVSEGTVTSTLRRVQDKVGVSGRAALVDRAYRNGQFPTPAQQQLPSGLLLDADQQHLLLLLAGGWTGARIGTEMKRSAQVIKTRIKELLQLLGADSNAHAVRLGWELGFLRHEIPPPAATDGDTARTPGQPGRGRSDTPS